jgi:Fe/S biogenesis protein NfuA
MVASEDTSGQLPTISFTPAAVEKLTEVAASHGRPLAGFRLQIAGRVDGHFQHVLSLLAEGAQTEHDIAVQAQGLRVFMDPDSASYVDGLQVDYRFRGPDVSGLGYLNPNPLWHDERELQIQDIFDNQINPAIASHGGSVMLLGVTGTTAYVRLGGGCQGCGMADVTLKQGIEATILQEVEGIDRVADETDHTAGQNPYHQPAKK